MFNLISSHWLVCNTLGAYVKALSVVIDVYAIPSFFVWQHYYYSLLCMQYLHCICNNLKSSHWCACNTLISFMVFFIIKCNTFIFYNLCKYLDVSLVLLCFVGLGANVLHGLPRNAWLGRKMGIGLFARLKLVMHFIQQDIYIENKIFPRNQGSLSTHLFSEKGCIVKTMHWWMHKSQANFLKIFDTTKKRQLLEQRPVPHASGITCEMMHYE